MKNTIKIRSFLVRHLFAANRRIFAANCFRPRAINFKSERCPEEMSAGQPKQFISQTNHGLTKSPEATLACFQFVEKAGRRRIGRLRSLLSLMRVRGWELNDFLLLSARLKKPDTPSVQLANILLMATAIFSTAQD